MLPLSLELACSWHVWILTEFWILDIFESWFFPVGILTIFPVVFCLFGRLCLPNISISWLPCLALSFDLACTCHIWTLTASFLLRATFSSLLFSVPDTPCCLPVVSYSLLFSSLLDCLQLSTFHQISIVFTFLLPWELSCMFVCVSVCSPSPLHTVAPSASVCSVPPMLVLVADHRIKPPSWLVGVHHVDLPSFMVVDHRVEPTSSKCSYYHLQYVRINCC